MAEAFGVAAGGLTVLELTIKVIKQCKTLIETAHDAPRDLRHILIEISSLKAVLESFDFLSRAEYSDTTQSLADTNGVVEGCRGTVEELAKELDGLTLANVSHVAPGKRQRIKGSMQWCLKESKTRKLLDEMMQHKSTLTLALLGEITSDVKQIKSTVEQVHDSLTETARRKVCDWIEHTNPTSIHQQSCKNHEEHTCQWIHRVDQWNDWLQLQRRLIWIHGIPGAGKTVFASYLVQQTIEYCENLKNDRAACLYYYCSFRHGQEERRDEALPFLRWVVSQLCRRGKFVPADLVSLHDQNSAPSFQALKKAFQQLLAHVDVLYIILDAVDESSLRDSLLELIEDIVTQPSYGKIQLLVTSRRYMDIEEVLRPLSEPTLPISNSLVDADIRTYVENIIQRNKTFAKWSAKLRSDIIESLVQGAQGMFRWVVCQIDRLQRKSPQQAREAIKCLPPTLEETYEIILLEIPQEDWGIARMALLWISGHSDLEIPYGIPAHCLSSAVLSTDHTFQLDSSEGGHGHEFLKFILGCLIELDSIDVDDVDDRDKPWPFSLEYTIDGDLDNPCWHTVSLAHYTIKEFLFSDRVKEGKASYFAMSRDICGQKILETVLQPMTEANHPFLHPYAYDIFKKYCNSIARICPNSWESLILQNDCFLRQHSDFFDKHKWEWDDLFYNWRSELIGYSVFDFEPTEDPTESKLQYLIAILGPGYVGIAMRLLDELCLEVALSVSVPLRKGWGNINDGSKTNALYITILHALGERCSFFSLKPHFDLLWCLRSRMDLSKLLIFYLGAHYHEYTCNERQSEPYTKPCVIFDLLDAGANANPSNCGLTPLQIAVRNWDYAGVTMLLGHGADPNCIGQPGGYIPAHINTIWAQSSPLHILRNAEYGFTATECCIGLKAERAEKWSEIEDLLLEYGAKDFVRSRPTEGHLRKLEVRHLLN